MKIKHLKSKKSTKKFNEAIEFDNSRSERPISDEASADLDGRSTRLMVQGVDYRTVNSEPYYSKVRKILDHIVVDKDTHKALYDEANDGFDKIHKQLKTEMNQRLQQVHHAYKQMLKSMILEFATRVDEEENKYIQQLTAKYEKSK